MNSRRISGSIVINRPIEVSDLAQWPCQHVYGIATLVSALINPPGERSQVGSMSLIRHVMTCSGSVPAYGTRVVGR